MEAMWQVMYERGCWAKDAHALVKVVSANNYF